MCKSILKNKFLCIAGAAVLLFSASAAVAKAENANYENMVEQYYDINFENESWESSVGSSTINPNTDGHFKPLVTMEKDPVKGSTIAKITGSGASGNYGCIRDKSITLTSIRQGTVIWYEMSFKFENKVTPVRLEAGEYPFMIEEGGKLRIGGLNGGTYVGVEIADLTLQPGEWYHLVVAVDNIDKWAGSDVKYYAWLNGKLLTSAETSITGCTVSKGYSSSPGNFGYWLFIPSDGSEVSVSFDDIKVYTTGARVKENGEFCFDPMNIFEGAEITSEMFRIEEDTIYAPTNETLAELSEYLITEGSGFGFMDGAEAVDEEEAKLSAAVGKTLVARSNSGKGVKKYNIEEGSRLYSIESAIWKSESGATFEKASDITENEKVIAELVVTNDTIEEKTGMLVIAAYNGTALSDCSFSQVTVPVGGATIKSNALEITNTENLTLMAYVWESADNYTPVLTRVNLAN